MNMKSLKKASFVLFFIFLGSNPAFGTIHKWVDKDGKMHFTNDINRIPEEYRNQPKNVKPNNKNRIQSRTLKNSSPLPANKELEQELQKLSNEMGKGMEKGIKTMAKELSKAFKGMGEGFAKLMAIAESNKPDMGKTSFESRDEKLEYQMRQFLVGMFLMCQFQFIIEKSKTCTDKSKNMTPEKKKEFKDFRAELIALRNTPTNLKIHAYHKNIKYTWEITHEGKSSIHKVPSKRIKNSKL